MLYLSKSFIVLRFYTFTTFNTIKMEAQFIYYKPKFMNLELKYKLTRVLIRLLVKKKYTNKIKPTNPT